MGDAGAGQPRQAIQAAVVGVSGSRTCGVRDHAVLLAEALSHQNVSCSLHWLWRSDRSIRDARTEFRAWTKALATELDEAEPGAIILHYSVFSYSYRGLPLFVHPTLAALRGRGIPLIVFLHEFAYPWRLGGLRGKAWSVTQNALLVEVMRACTAAVVTAPFRAEHLESRRWLARRPVAFAPVFSNLPAPASPRSRTDREGHVVGLFGYAYQGAASSLVLDAVRLLYDRGLRVRLELLGAPGRESPAADAWLADARARGIERALSFSGILSAQDLSNALADCDVLIHPEPAGPTSRKGTLAASLASGSAVVAIDGRRRWAELLQSESVLVVQASAPALADAVAGLLEDEGGREELGARGAAFASRAMGLERSAQAVAGLLEDLLLH